MSMVTTHYLKFDNAKERLDAAGVCPPDVLTRRNGQSISFKNVLDYTRCCPELAAEVRSYYAEQGKEVMNLETAQYEKVAYTEKELDQMLKFPISFKDDDTVMWFVNYDSDALPGKMISKLFPEETMVYAEKPEGVRGTSTYMKSGDSCTADGRKIEDVIPCYGATGVPGKPGVCRVSLPVDNTDKRFAILYTDTKNVQPADLFSSDGRKMLCVEDVNAKATLYRCLADGTKTKETMTFDDLHSAVVKAMDDYRSQPKKPKQRALPTVADAMDAPQNDTEYEA